MSNTVKIQPAARTDIQEVIQWYNDQQTGLGARFLANLTDAIRRIARSPGIFQVRYRNVRQAPVKKFPIAVFYFYLKEEKQVVVTAIMHTARDPQAWKERT